MHLIESGQMYDRKHYFCLGLIPKLKLELADTVTDFTFQRENLFTDSMWYF